MNRCQRKPFGESRQLDAVEAGASVTLEASVARLRAEVEAWCGSAGAHDDLSVLAVELGRTG